MKRLAMQLVLQLPDDPREARFVLDYAQREVERLDDHKGEAVVPGARLRVVDGG